MLTCTVNAIIVEIFVPLITDSKKVQKITKLLKKSADILYNV